MRSNKRGTDDRRTLREAIPAAKDEFEPKVVNGRSSARNDGVPVIGPFEIMNDPD